MEQFLLHAIGDYLTQTNRMAVNKTSSWFLASLHGVVYSVPFFIIGSLSAVAVICVTHIVIDRFRLARFVVFAKNWATEPQLRWADCSKTGYPDSVPVWMSVWLLIIADNIMHISINYAALRWL